jgi:hypothetical protein
VASRYAYGLGHLRSFAADLAAQGAQITTRLVAADTVAAPEDVGARLGAARQVLRLRRLRLADGRPVIVQTSYLAGARWQRVRAIPVAREAGWCGASRAVTTASRVQLPDGELARQAAGRDRDQGGRRSEW